MRVLLWETITLYAFVAIFELLPYLLCRPVPLLSSSLHLGGLPSTAVVLVAYSVLGNTALGLSITTSIAAAVLFQLITHCVLVWYRPAFRKAWHQRRAQKTFGSLSPSSSPF